MYEGASIQQFWIASQLQFHSGNWFARSASEPELYVETSPGVTPQVRSLLQERNETVPFFPSSAADIQSKRVVQRAGGLF